MRSTAWIAAGVALLALAATSGALAEPGASPAERPALFDRLFDRREYLRQSEPLRRPAEAASREARQARELAAEARRAATLPALPPRPLTLQPVEGPGDSADARRRAVAAAENARQRQMQERLQQFLAGSARADTAAVASNSSAARAARVGTIVDGMDRLQAGAAAARSTLGREPVLRPRPLIRSPRVDAD